MSLISRTISNMFGGVSQQPAPLRSDSQCELMDNGWPDVAVGLGKRPSSIHVARLNTDVTANRAVHLINRDVSEKYAVVAKSGEIKVYDLLTGTEKTVSIPDGTSYLTSTNPKQDLAFLTVADTTFVVNRSKSITMDAASAYTAPNVLFVYILAAVARQTYTIVLNGTPYTYTVAADGSTALTTTVATGLAALIPSATFTVTQQGSCLKIVKNDASAFTGYAVDSYGDQGLMYFTDSVENTAQLPPRFWANYIIKVRGSLEEGQDDFYVKWNSTNEQWVETVAGGLQNTLTASTMPHKLVRNADGTWTFSKITWTSRVTGDDITNPAPSFVGKKLNNVFFFRERLGFLVGENIAMSRATDYYNFFASTASAVVDDDPIDITVADSKVAYLYHTIAFQESLLVFSDTAQFQLTGGDVLSPKTARLDATTRFNTSKYIAPVGAGRDVYFAVDRGNYSSIREYFVLPDGVNSDAVDVTAHVPAYVPKNLGGMAASTLLDCVFLYSKDSPNKLYLYKYLWSGDQKVQSSWGTITFATGDTIIGLDVIDTKLYLVIQRSDGTYVEYIDFQAGGTETGMTFRVYLDRRYELTGVYDAPSDTTTWTLPYADTSTYDVVRGSAFGTQAGGKLQVTHPTSTTLVASGNYSAGTCFVGRPYTMTVRLSVQYVKDREGKTQQNGVLKLKTLGVSYSDTGYFKVEVTPQLRDKNTYTFTGTILGAGSATLGTVSISDGVFKLPVISGNEGLTIDFINDSPVPSFFQGYTWEGMYTTRAKPV